MITTEQVLLVLIAHPAGAVKTCMQVSIVMIVDMFLKGQVYGNSIPFVNGR
jgi:hypothetical protein